MNKVLERIVAHAAPDKVRRLEVPEWGEDGQPLVITYTMVTLDDMATVDAADGDQWYKRAARIVALKARDEAGKPLFGLGDAVTLREQAAPHVVNRIAMAMLGGTTVEQAEKN
jgi:hypothetical protein